MVDLWRVRNLQPRAVARPGMEGDGRPPVAAVSPTLPAPAPGRQTQGRRQTTRPASRRVTVAGAAWPLMAQDGQHGDRVERVEFSTERVGGPYPQPQGLQFARREVAQIQGD